MPNNQTLVVSLFGRRVELKAATLLPTQSRRMCRVCGIKGAAVLLIVGAALLSFTHGSGAQPINQVIVFGDSNVDSGYYKALSNPGGNATYNSLWPAAVADGAGAPTTNPGLVNSQMLANFLGLTANPANTPGGTNYATSGAKNVTVNNSQTGGFTAAIPTVTQIQNYLTAQGGTANSQALYFIHSGDNDAKYAAGESGAGPYPPDPNSYMTGAADQLAAAIQSLYSAGARHFLVSGLEYDYPSSDANLKALKLLYTQTLWSQLTSLGVPFIAADVDSVRLAISANPSLYGFTTISNTGSGPACTQPSGVGSAWALLCSSNLSAPSTWTAPTAQTHLFADDQHLGTAGQQLMANYLYQLIAPLPAAPTSGVAPLTVSFSTGLLPIASAPYTVNFGDGTNGALVQGQCAGISAVVGGQGGIQCSGSASHTYTTAGSYPATLLNASNKTLGIATITVTSSSAGHNRIVPPGGGAPVMATAFGSQTIPARQDVPGQTNEAVPPTGSTSTFGIPFAGSNATVPTISSFTASPVSISPFAGGGSATLSWSVSSATSLSISGLGAVTGTSIQVTPSETTTYTLTAGNAQGAATAQTTVTVAGYRWRRVDSLSR